MTYTVNIVGHKDTTDAEESRNFEMDVAAKAREFVASLEGVTSAQGTFGQIGSQDLRAAE